VNPCRVCGRELDDCGTCVCIDTSLGRFLRYAIDTCVNPEPPEPTAAQMAEVEEIEARERAKQWVRE
jgi:hypothetical protein